MSIFWEILIVIFLILAAGYYEGSETGFYTVSRLKVRVNKDKGSFTYNLLFSLLREEERIIFTTLCGTNLCHYIVTSMVTGMFADVAENMQWAEIYATAVLTPTLFLFSQVLPKNIYYTSADRLMPWGSYLLWISHKLFTYTGLVPGLKFLSRLAARIIGISEKGESLIEKAQRHHMAEIVRESHNEEVLSSVQTKIIEQVINISNATIGSVMVPINTVLMISEDTIAGNLFSELEKSTHPHRIVFAQSRQNITGYINVYEILNCGMEFKNVSEFVRPLSEVAANTPVMKALNIMIKGNHKILLITGTSIFGKKTVEGIVTMKDIAQKLTGVLASEADLH